MFTYLKSSFVFALHLFVTVLAWVAPFLFSWKLCLAAYTLVMLQFTVFGKCLMNEHHGLDEAGNRIFYTDLMEMLGFSPDRARVKFIVRKLLYPALALVAIIWQVAAEQEPWMF
jgi:hypothetical protein